MHRSSIMYNNASTYFLGVEISFVTIITLCKSSLNNDLFRLSFFFLLLFSLRIRIVDPVGDVHDHTVHFFRQVDLGRQP